MILSILHWDKRVKTMKIVFLVGLYFCIENLVANELTEYCSQETFHAKCDASGVVIMQEALFGRIQLGKCISSDIMIGCMVNILDITDQQCSGQRECNIPIPTKQMKERLHCLDHSLRGSANLEASYFCQRVYIPRSKQCRSPEKISSTKELQYLSSKISTETSCGLHGSPWILEAVPGQQIQISMMDFSWKNDTHETDECLINYGYILNMDNDDVIHICGGGKREKQLYISSGHSLQIVLESSTIERNTFLLAFKSVGCPDYKPPNHSWIQKENDTLVIGCVSSDDTWKLQCVDNRWLGVVGKCIPTVTTKSAMPTIKSIESKGGVESDNPAVELPNISNNHVIVFTMACLTILVCCIIIILGVYYIKRYNVKILKYSKPNYSTTESYHSGRLTLGSVPVTYRTLQKHTGDTFKPPAYTFSLPKDQHAPKVPPRNTTGKDMPLDGNIFGENNMYENVNEDAESVKYYILENPAGNENNVS